MTDPRVRFECHGRRAAGEDGRAADDVGESLARR